MAIWPPTLGIDMQSRPQRDKSCGANDSVPRCGQARASAKPDGWRLGIHRRLEINLACTVYVSQQLLTFKARHGGGRGSSLILTAPHAAP